MANLIHSRPYLTMKSLQEEVERLFGDVFPSRAIGSETLPRMWSPLTDLSELENEYVLKMDLPGLPKENIEIKIEDHRLVVSGEKKEETKKEGENFLSAERCYGSFYRSFSLPSATKEEAIKAEFENGVLTIHVPKVETAQPRKVSIS